MRGYNAGDKVKLTDAGKVVALILYPDADAEELNTHEWTILHVTTLGMDVTTTLDSDVWSFLYEDVEPVDA